MAKKGEVYSIETNKGEAYFQYHSRNKLMGPLIRVLVGEYREPVDLNILVEGATRFWVFFPVDAAFKENIIKKHGVFEIPGHAKNFPLFRGGNGVGKIDVWWFWDGEREWKVGDISAEQRKMPIRGIWNDTMLISRIESGWLPENDPR